MKKVSLILSLVLFMFLGGCLSKKTEQQLSEVPGTNGGTPGVTNGDYVFKSSEGGTFETITGSFMEFSYDKAKNKYTGAGGTSFELTPTGEILPYASIKSLEGTTLNLSDELKTLVDTLIPEGVSTKKSEGSILFSKLNKGTYEKGEIVKGSEKYTYILAKISLPLISGGVTKTYTYLVRTVVKNDTASELSIFENIMRTFTAKLPVSKIDLTKQTELIKNLRNLNKLTNYSDETLKQTIYKAIDDFYVYIEGAYIDSSVSSTEKREKAVEYIKQPLEYIESSTVTIKVTDVYSTIVKLLEKTEMTYRDNLEGEISKAIASYNSDVDGKNRSIANLSDLEDSFKKLVDNQIKQDSLQKYVYNKEFWKNVVLSEYRSDNLVQEAIDWIIIGNLEDIRINKLGEGKNPATSGLQPLPNYEEQMIKTTEFASYKFYSQDLFLPKADKGIDQQMNIQDYLMIEGANFLKNDGTNLGKTAFKKDVFEQRTSKQIYEKAYKNIIGKKQEWLSLKNKEYFDKIETAYINKTLSTLDLSEKRIAIETALENLVNSVKIYDTADLLTGGLTLASLKSSVAYELSLEYVSGKIKNITSPIDYELYSLSIPFDNGKIDLLNLAKTLKNTSLGFDEVTDKKDYNGDGDQLDTLTFYAYTLTGVDTALSILNHQENNE